jgi:hypothetical protein
MNLGDTEVKYNSTTDTDTDWKDFQILSFYLGGGFIYTGEIPLTHANTTSTTSPPNNTLTHKQPDYFSMFFGGGIDFNLYAQLGKDTDGTYDTDMLLYVFDVAVVGIAGVRMPMGFIFHVAVSGHILLDWEYRFESSILTLNFTDMADLIIPFFGMEAGITYEVPLQPHLRFGLIGKFINYPMFILHAGYIF